MRKSTKLAILVLALVALCSVSAFAAVKGTWTWDAAANEWTFVDSDGYLVSGEWAKDTNGKYYYLDDDGFMAREKLVDDGENTFWVGADGAKVVSAWVQVPVEEDSDEDFDEEYRWMYFDKAGKAYKGAKKTINGADYCFDENGKMSFGYVDANYATVNTDDPFDAAVVYYCGTNEDGAVKKNFWAKITGVEDKGAYEADKDAYWVYFKTNGKKATDEGSDAYGVKYEGKRYYFDELGRMKTEWSEIGTPATRTSWLGEEDEGWMYKKTWVYTANDDDDDKWYYVDVEGKNVYKNAVAKINGKYYAFNDAFEMEAGIVGLSEDIITAETTVTETGIEADKMSLDAWLAKTGNFFYFSGDYKNDGSLKKSVTVEIEFLDDTYKLTTNKNGKFINGSDGAKNPRYYINGYLLAAEADWGKQVIMTDDGYKLLDTNGYAVKVGKTANDADGNVYAVTEAKIYMVPEYVEKPATVAKAVVKGETEVKIGSDWYTISSTDSGKGYDVVKITKK